MALFVICWRELSQLILIEAQRLGEGQKSVRVRRIGMYDAYTLDIVG
ncbi:hypothetical protein POX_g08995 [Penicillium oxalicum]|nr:hypothetical protein POX_g08995 [Penicillium oxalicum]KAI2786607.1 hypothetical protein POX_g08995 [Penicillium oxalicum]